MHAEERKLNCKDIDVQYLLQEIWCWLREGREFAIAQEQVAMGKV